MSLYLLFQHYNTNTNDYHSVVVCAESREEAEKIHPADKWEYSIEQDRFIRIVDGYLLEPNRWAPYSDVKSQYIGEAADHVDKGVVIYSLWGQI